MKKLFTLIALIFCTTLSSCDLLQNEPPYTLEYSEWESNEIIVEMPGGITIGLVYVLKFESETRFSLTLYSGSSIYGESITGTYSYQRPYVSLSGYYTSMAGKAIDYSYMELYDEYYDVPINFFRNY